MKARQKNIRANTVEDMSELMAQFSTQIEKDLNVLWARQPMQAFAPIAFANTVKLEVFVERVCGERRV
jgi:hypothetical protein